MNTLNSEWYARFKKLISTRYGLFFGEDKRRQFESVILSAFSKSTFSNLDNYYLFLTNDKSAGQPHGVASTSGHTVTTSPLQAEKELQKLVNMLTVGETHFYRNQAHINSLRHHILPEIIDRNKSAKTLRIWSAGCSTGEEPYTIAILLHEILPDINLWKVFLLGTDINSAVLMKAGKAVYGNWSFRNTPESVRSSYFQPINDKYRLRGKIRRIVTFKQHNLMDFHTYPGELDLILCRNVTIYFKRETIQKIAAKFHDVVVDGGWLLVGHSEPAPDIYHRFNVKSFPGAVAYQKPNGQVIAQPVIPFSPKGKNLLSPQQKSSARTPLFRGLTQQTRIIPEQTRVTPERTGTLAGFADVGVPSRAYANDSEAVLQSKENTSPYDTAIKLIDEGDYERAMAKFQEQLQLQPTHAESYYKLALIYQQQEQWDDAIEMLKKSIYIERHFVLAHFILANVYKKTGKNQLAKKSFDNVAKLLSEKPDDEIVPHSDGLTVGRLAAAVSASLGSGERKWV